MTFTKLIVVLVCLATGAPVAHEPKVAQVLSKDLTDIPGKEGLMLTVEYPQRASPIQSKSSRPPAQLPLGLKARTIHNGSNTATKARPWDATKKASAGPLPRPVVSYVGPKRKEPLDGAHYLIHSKNEP